MTPKSEFKVVPITILRESYGCHFGGVGLHTNLHTRLNHLYGVYIYIYTHEYVHIYIYTYTVVLLEVGLQVPSYIPDRSCKAGLGAAYEI